jgi:hypothetical protein
MIGRCISVSRKPRLIPQGRDCWVCIGSIEKKQKWWSLDYDETVARYGVTPLSAYAKWAAEKWVARNV